MLLPLVFCTLLAHVKAFWTGCHFATPFSPFYDFHCPFQMSLSYSSCSCCCCLSVCVFCWLLPLSKCHLENSIALWFCFVYFHKVFSLYPPPSPTQPQPTRDPNVFLQLARCIALGLVISSDSALNRFRVVCWFFAAFCLAWKSNC